MRNGWRTDDTGTRRHFVNDERHSVGDNPAVICINGDKFWMRHDDFHRDKGLPAIVYSNGTKSFYENGLLQTPCECGHFAKKYCPTRKVG